MRSAGDGVALVVWVTPGAARSALAGVRDGALRVRVAAPAREGRANRELERYLAETLGVARAAVAVRTGAGGRRKTVTVAGCTAERVRFRLGL